MTVLNQYLPLILLLLPRPSEAYQLDFFEGRPAPYIGKEAEMVGIEARSRVGVHHPQR